MPQHPVTGRVTRRWGTCWSGLRADLDDLLGRVDFQCGQDIALGFGRLGGLAEGPGRAGVGDRVQALEFGADPVPAPGVAGGYLGDADEQQGSQPVSPDSPCAPSLRTRRPAFTWARTR